MSKTAIPRPPYLHELPHGDGSITWTEGTPGHIPTAPFALTPPTDSIHSGTPRPARPRQSCRREQGEAPGSSRNILCHGRGVCTLVCVLWCIHSEVCLRSQDLRLRPGRFVEGRPF